MEERHILLRYSRAPPDAHRDLPNHSGIVQVMIEILPSLSISLAQQIDLRARFERLVGTGQIIDCTEYAVIPSVALNAREIQLTETIAIAETDREISTSRVQQARSETRTLREDNARALSKIAAMEEMMIEKDEQIAPALLLHGGDPRERLGALLLHGSDPREHSSALGCKYNGDKMCNLKKHFTRHQRKMTASEEATAICEAKELQAHDETKNGPFAVIRTSATAIFKRNRAASAKHARDARAATRPIVL